MLACQSRIRKVLILTLLMSPGFQDSVDAQDNDQPPKAAAAIAVITVSPETTHFTEPLNDDALVNLAAALNRHYGNGVAPENNAAVVLYEVLGPNPDGARLSDDFFKQLGVAVPSPEGNYFLGYGRWLNQAAGGSVPTDQLNAALDDQESSREAPWKRAELPQVFDWLAANRAPLERLAKGVQRSDYFSPLIPPEGPDGQPGNLIASLLPGVQVSRELARALTSRAMLNLGEGRTDEAWQDLLTTHRLGRQIGRGPTLIEQLVGIAIESIAIDGEQKWLAIAKPGAQRIARIRKQLDALPVMSRIVDSIDTTERILFVDCVVRLARNQLDMNELGVPEDALPNVMRQLVTVSVDWNSVLRRGNSSYDEMTAAMRIADRSRRNAALDAFDVKLKEHREKAMAPGTLALSIVPGLTSAIVTEAITATMTSLLLPAVRAASTAEEQQQQRLANLQTTLTLFDFHAETGEFPETLDAVVPLFADAMPNDLFSEKPLKYRRTANGFELYSIGKNETDDGGRTFGEENPGDDLVVRISLAKPDSAN